MSLNISLRPITEQDMGFLYRVYASTRESEMSLLDWSSQQKHDFLAMQFRAQHVYYQEHYADADFDLVLLDGEPIGRLYLHRRADEVRIIDIALLTEHRGRGIGSFLMHRILDEAEGANLPVAPHLRAPWARRLRPIGE